MEKNERKGRTIPIIIRHKIARLRKEGLAFRDIQMRLESDDKLAFSLNSIRLTTKRVIERGTVADLVRSGRPRKLNYAQRQMIDEQMEKDDETSSLDLQRVLWQKSEVIVSTSTIRRERQALGWVQENTHFCQVIRKANKAKCMEFFTRVTETRERYDKLMLFSQMSVR